MTDTVRRATWHTLASFILCAVVIAGVIYGVRHGWRIESGSPGQAAFGGGQADDATTLYMTQAQLCETFFREPFETCIVVMSDLAVMTFSTHEAQRIGVSAPVIIDHLKKCGYAVKDIVVIAHNHFTPSGFTPADKTTHLYLKSLGFRGAFGIWYTATKKFVKIEDTK